VAKIVAGVERADAVLIGSAQYRIFARMWPHQTDDLPMAKFLNHSLKNVASRTPVPASEFWTLQIHNALIIRGL
jgi:hypothetical protein